MREMNGQQVVRSVFLVVVLALVLLTGACSVSCVKTGHVGVVTRFGKVTGAVLSEGVNLVSPINAVQQLSIRTQEIKETSSTPSEEGLIFALEVSLLYRLAPTSA